MGNGRVPRKLPRRESIPRDGRRTSSRFPCTIVFPSPEHLKDWLHDWYEPVSATKADRLVRRVEEASQQPELTGKIIAVVPLMLKVLTKRNGSSY
jgi:hypothetical protein